MDGPTTAEPTPIAERAQRVWTRLAERTAHQPPAQGQGVTEAMLLEEVSGELQGLHSTHEAEAAVLAEEHAAHIAELQDTLAAVHATEIAVLQLALAEALSRAPQIKPVSGTAEQWRARLKAMPPLASHEIDAWYGAALRRLGAVGITQADVMIARLAEMLLRPHTQPPTPNAETT